MRDKYFGQGSFVRVIFRIPEKDKKEFDETVSNS